MIFKHNNSEAVIIVNHEIYGVNLHIKGVCESLFKQGFDVICPNLLDQEVAFDYAHEDVAYSNFIDNIGFTRASETINKLLFQVKDNYHKIFIVGFSVGATIAWLCGNKEFINGVVGYYGSRIRNFLDVVPQCTTLLFFPHEEESINVDKLITKLEERNIKSIKFDGFHGFSDPYSTKYHAESSSKAYNAMLEFLMKN
ncbi:dienelactone hydrolase family protein [Metabacillus schmidteae]|uniref:dienelactone hydrolase family protein n=1 Tax=Metabacillus schmidteae TaxID=2730405 RepID=UPI00158E3AAA|nr:dienelactone hydrolase family protein [Metabacillus schmidteae]